MSSPQRLSLAQVSVFQKPLPSDSRKTAGPQSSNCRRRRSTGGRAFIAMSRSTAGWGVGEANRLRPPKRAAAAQDGGHHPGVEGGGGKKLLRVFNFAQKLGQSAG